MKYHGSPSADPADVSAFVTYQAEEYLQDDDDGTDLPLPDLSQFTPAEPAPRGRTSGTARPLREMIDAVPDTESAEPPPDAEADRAFGDGVISDDSPAVAVSETTTGLKATDVTDSDAPTDPEKRKRRRRRRRNRPHKSKSAATEGNSEVPADSDNASASAQDQCVTDGEATGPETEATVKKRPNRRRRRRRKPRSDDGGDSVDT